MLLRSICGAVLQLPCVSDVHVHVCMCVLDVDSNVAIACWSHPRKLCSLIAKVMTDDQCLARNDENT